LISESLNRLHPSEFWLALQGAFNDVTSGHAGAASDASNVFSCSLYFVQRNLATLLGKHLAFIRVVFTSTQISKAASNDIASSLRCALHSKNPQAFQIPPPPDLLYGPRKFLLRV
jgi:hypothetical protein